MKPTTYLLATLLLTSCAGWQRIGNLTMVSTRNVDSGKAYGLVLRNAEGTARTSQDDALQAAIDAAVAKHPGGEYLQNVAVYVRDNGMQVKVTGDVYGVEVAPGTAPSSVTGSVAMQAGDAVLWHVRGAQPRRATLVGIRGEKGTIEIPTRGRPLLREVYLRDLTRTP